MAERIKMAARITGALSLLLLPWRLFLLPFVLLSLLPSPLPPIPPPAPPALPPATPSAPALLPPRRAGLLPPVPAELPPHPWPTHDWELLSVNEMQATLAAEWLALYRQIQDRAGVWVDLLGGGQQCDTTQAIGLQAADVKRRILCSVTEAALRAQLQSLDVSSTASLHCAAMKLLRSRPGGKDQEVHFDISDLDKASTRWSMVLYCNDSMSTAVPRYPAAVMAPAFVASAEATRAEQRQCNALCDQKHFISLPVQPGHVLAFQTTVAHYGVASRGPDDRVVLYALFSPDDQPHQDDEQRFPLGAPRCLRA